MKLHPLITRYLLALLLFHGLFSFAQVDPQATQATKNLYCNLKKFSNGDHLIYGQHHAFLLGHYMKLDGSFSDCKYICGDNPGLIGYNLVKYGQWDAGDTTQNFVKQIKATHARGGINTVMWTMENPSSGQHVPSEGVVAEILEGNNPTSAYYKQHLADAAAFFKVLKDEEGKLIPILFRPLHEQLLSNGKWWNTNFCTAEEYKQLWILTYEILTNEHQVHNLIWVQSPNKPDTEERYMARFPGFAYVDIIGFDSYRPGVFAEDFLSYCRTVVSIAEKNDKIAAVTEMGDRSGFDEETPHDWYTQQLIDNIKDDPTANKLAYWMTWGSVQWSAYPPGDPKGAGQNQYEDFIKFYEDDWSVFEQDLPELFSDCQEVNTPPHVQINSPADGTNYSESPIKIPVEVVSSDPFGWVVKVQLYIDENLEATRTAPNVGDEGYVWYDRGGLRNLPPGSHEIKVIATDNEGAVAEAISTITISLLTELSSNQSKSSILDVYPNPTNSMLHISGEFTRWELFDLRGQSVQAGSSEEIDLSSMAKGMYVLQFKDGQHKQVILE